MNEAMPVVALTLEGEFVGEYKSQSEAARSLSLRTQSICGCISGALLRCGDYIFIPKEKYNPDKKITYSSLRRKRKHLSGK